MRTLRRLMAAFIFLLALPSLYAQEKAAQEAPLPDVPLRVQILLTEYNGTQKVNSLPYALYTVSNEPRGNRHSAHLRLGVKVPIATAEQSGTATQFAYQDVGTNIDCTVNRMGENQFSLDLMVERSSVSMPGSHGEESDWKPGDMSLAPQPIVRSFRDNVTLIMKDGATMEGTSAVDPVTGHVLKIEVTLNVLK